MKSRSDGIPVKDTLTAVLGHRTSCGRGLHLGIEMGGKHGMIELIQGMNRAEVVASLRNLADLIEREAMNAHGHGLPANQAIMEGIRLPDKNPT